MEKTSIEKAMEHSIIGTSEQRPTATFTRRSAITVFGAAMVMVNVSPLAISQSRSQQLEGAMTMAQYAMNKKTVSDAVVFYELFRDEAALKAHQESAYFKTFIAGEALPLLSKRERAQYALL